MHDNIEVEARDLDDSQKSESLLLPTTRPQIQLLRQPTSLTQSKFPYFAGRFRTLHMCIRLFGICLEACSYRRRPSFIQILSPRHANFKPQEK